MAVLITKIQRDNPVPIVASVTNSNNKGYIAVVPNNWNAQMFYELPSLKFEIYVKNNDKYVKYKNFCKIIRTYNPIFPLDLDMNGTVEIDDIPNTFYLFITPMFDNNAISARNELIRNGIENGDIWNTITNTFDILIKFNEYNEGQAGQDITVSGIPPLQIVDNYGDYLVDYKIYGNTIQSGTPTPAFPVDVVGVGERTENLVPPDLYRNPMVMQGVVNGVTVCISSQGGAVYVIPAAGGETYTIKVHTGDKTLSVLRCGFIDIETPTHGLQVTQAKEIIETKNPTLTVTNSDNKLYFAFQISRSYADEYGLSTVMLNTGNTALPYEPYGYKIPVSCGGVTTPIYLGQTQSYREIKKYVCTGEEQWQSNGVGTDNAFFYIDLEPLNVSYGLSTHFTKRNVWSSNTVVGFGLEGTGILRIRLENAATYTTTSFKQWLADQLTAGTPVTVWYVLSEPETGIVNEPLMKIGDYADTLDNTGAGIMIPTVRGDNTLSIDTTIQPSNVSITYTQQLH